METQPHKACPMCGELILAVAIKCKHCQSMLNAPPQPAETAHLSAAVAKPVADETGIAPVVTVRRFWRTAGMFLLGSLPGVLVLAFYSSGLFIRMMGGHIEGHLDAALTLIGISFLIGAGAFSIPAAFVLAGALHATRGKNELAIATLVGVGLGCAFYFAVAAVWGSVANAAVPTQGIDGSWSSPTLTSYSPVVFGAALAAAGGTLLAAWKGRLAPGADGLVATFVNWLAAPEPDL